MDGCEYMCCGTAMHGLVQNLLRSTRHEQCVFLLIRRLTPSTPRPGNTLAVTKYNNTYYKYATNKMGHLQLDLVPQRDVQYPLFFVSDPLNGTELFGDPCTHIENFETEENRINSRFFRVATVPLISFRESLSYVPDE